MLGTCSMAMQQELMKIGGTYHRKKAYCLGLSKGISAGNCVFHFRHNVLISIGFSSEYNKVQVPECAIRNSSYVSTGVCFFCIVV